jgi:hypothetical protein
MLGKPVLTFNASTGGTTFKLSGTRGNSVVLYLLRLKHVRKKGPRH